MSVLLLDEKYIFFDFKLAVRLYTSSSPLFNIAMSHPSNPIKFLGNYLTIIESFYFCYLF